MTAIPTSLEAAIAQSRAATRAAIENGVPRMIVEFAYPELKGAASGRAVLSGSAGHGPGL